MPTSSAPANHADDLREAARGLAKATRLIEDPTDIGPVLASINSALICLTQTLHQLGDLHDGPTAGTASMTGDPHLSRAASFRVSGELHRAGEMLHQIAEGVDRAREGQSTFAYDVRDLPLTPVPPSVHAVVHDGGLSM